jgi:hypothetical protein
MAPVHFPVGHAGFSGAQIVFGYQAFFALYVLFAGGRTRLRIRPLAGAHALQCIYADVRILWFRGAGKQPLLPLVRRSPAVR